MFAGAGTFTTAHMCGSPTDWQEPMIPCYGSKTILTLSTFYMTFDLRRHTLWKNIRKALKSDHTVYAGTCPGPACRNGTTGLPVQDPTQIKKRNIDYMCPVLDWVRRNTDVSCCFLRCHLYVKMISLPRQARDKHMYVSRNVEGRGVFSLQVKPLNMSACEAAGLKMWMYVHLLRRTY